MEEVRKLKLMFNKGGSGSETARLAIPTTWVKDMGLNKEEKEVLAIANKKHIIIRKSTNDRKYLLIRDFDTISEIEIFNEVDVANKKAEFYWDHLTSSEKKKGHIYVGFVTESMLSPDAFNEDGDIEDWTAYWDLDMNEECFDSEKEKNENGIY